MTDEFASAIAFTRDFDIGREILLTFMPVPAKSWLVECYKTISNFYDRAWKQSYTSIGANRSEVNNYSSSYFSCNNVID